MEKRIVIGCTPRTGSSSLIEALERHPYAVSAGEAFAIYEGAPALELDIHSCNLMKLFASDSQYEDFKKVQENAIIVYLYRQDREAQLRSWEKALATGVWHPHQPPLPPRNDLGRDHMVYQIESAKDIFKQHHLTLEFSWLIHNWETACYLIWKEAQWELGKAILQSIPPIASRSK